MFIQLITNGIIAGCAYALVAIGFGLIYSTTRILHFAHGAIYTLAAYVFFALYVLVGWHVGSAALLALAVASVTGGVINEIIYRPLIERGTSSLILVLSSIGVYTIIVNLIAMLYGSETKVLYEGAQTTYSVGTVILTEIQILIAGVFIIVFWAYKILLKKTAFGKVIRAVRDYPDLVSAMGVDLPGTRRAVFALGSAISALAAILLGMDVGIDPNMGMSAVLNGAIAVIIGGVGVFRGAVVGAFVLGILQSLVVGTLSGRWADALAFVVLTLFLLFRPEGILGHTRRMEEAAS